MSDNIKDKLKDAEERDGHYLLRGFNAGEEGQYFLMVRDVARDGGPAFAYRIEVHPGPALGAPIR